MSSRWRAGFLAVMALSSACISTQLVNLDNVDLPLPAADPGAGWRGEMHTLLERYETAPVLAPEDDRLEPLFGGLTTLSYFGADAEPRVRDQQISPGPARGQPLTAACSAPRDESSEVSMATSSLPAFSPVWIPLARNGGAAPDATHCDEHGRPAGRGAEQSFCMFARLALQREDARPLIVVVHGMFDSGRQEYVQRMAAALYRLGLSVLVPDMRDHGDTLRAAPELATTLGTLEGPDLLALVQAARQTCPARIGRAGVAGVSGGGLDAIRAFTLDRQGSLDAGVLAISPLLDVPAAIHDLTRTGPCPLTQTIELSWQDDLAITLAGGAALFGGAALVQGLEGQRLDGYTALAGGIGAGAGLLTSLVVDAFFDGGSEPCVAYHSIAQIVQDALRVRWRVLQNPELGATLSPAGRHLEPAALTIDDYLRERAKFCAARIGVELRQFDVPTLVAELRAALRSSERRDARLLVIGAEDDPMTRMAALNAFVRQTQGIRQVYSRAVRHGGHGAIWLVQPTITRGIVARFFGESHASP